MKVKKRQQRVLMILDSKNIKYDVVDIAEPGNEDAKEFMQNNAKSLGATVSDTNPRSPLPPQIFNDEDYCGDYDQFDLANEMDEIEKFLKLPYDSSELKPTLTSNAEIKLENSETKVDEEVLKDAEIEVEKAEIEVEKAPEEEEHKNNTDEAEEEKENAEEVIPESKMNDDVKKSVTEDATENDVDDKDESKQENGIVEPESVEE
ncbi:hypothetical protein FQA39_LY15289 [Lamprigera yunnana]|nr:hypothetical protein FQA39_LY15289 [Lamprigera yunnana]